MGFYSIYRVFKDMIKTLFGKGFLKILLLFVFLFLAYVIFASEGVFAVSSINFDSSIFTQEDIDAAHNLLGDAIWNNDDYDLLFTWVGGAWKYGNETFNNSGKDLKYGKCLLYYNKSNLNSSYYYTCGNFNNTNQNGFIWRSTGIDLPVSFNKYYKYIYNQNDAQLSTNSGVGVGSNITTSDVAYFMPIRLSFDIYDNQGNIILNKNYYSTPTITTENVENWDFDNLVINIGNLTYNSSYYFGLNYTYDNVYYYQDISNYYDSVSRSFVIPRNMLCTDVVLRNGSTIEFDLAFRSPAEALLYNLGSYILSFSSAEQEEINEDSNKYIQSQILEQQQQTNQKLDNIDNTINNSNIDDITSDTLPSDDTQDITASGVNGIFTSIYNAFCTGTAQDIVFPIPFTNNSITLQANYVSSMLTNANATWVITIIQAFWWYLISRFIIKDVMNKINKIKSGEIEEIETTNIRGDML